MSATNATDTPGYQTCPACGQIDQGQTGEHPCSVCGLPLIWDSPALENADYPPEWPAIARAIKDAAGWHCVRCGRCHESAAGYTLTVHHLSGVKSDLAWHNLVALCQRCHLHIQGKVDMARQWPFEHSEWFKPYAAGHYARVYLGLELTRPEVEARLDDLLALERRI